jgi:hypothetical protein
VCDALFLKEPQSFDGNLINLARKAGNAGSGCQLIEAAHAIFSRQEFDKDGLHETTSLRQVYLEPNLPPTLESSRGWH